jgi:hypothetical protein
LFVKQGVNKLMSSIISSLLHKYSIFPCLSPFSHSFTITIHLLIVEHICSFFITFFSATIDGRNLIFGHKLHIGTPYCGKRFYSPALWQTGSRNQTSHKALPTIWGTYIKLVTKYQISAINSCWEKCDEKWPICSNRRYA